ncbi:MAG: D-aminoacyl-tRNA deacylase [Eubacteriales bacterium]|nr:D-aminoacyl-tRNA deacylase [Eubacteriales bacterium]
MRIVIQRVSWASVRVEGKVTGEIGPGLMVLVGVGTEDTNLDAKYLADKAANLRIFADAQGNMNLSLLDTGGEALVVSQFTLYGDCRRGRRPSWHLAAQPDLGNKLYQEFCRCLAEWGVHVETGIFGAMMAVEIHNDGPVTLALDSKGV